MVEIEKPRIECVENPGDGSYGKYVVEPLERGYGTTLGNSLRRILLSSLPGTAVTSIKIAGVQHEFSTIPGVKEDVTEIVLNVKSIIAKLHCEGVKTVYIEASGECEVTAGDIKADGEVEILNPELHIATLGPDASLNMELTLSHGRGYVPADRNKPAQTIIGLIPVDSIYTPVRKVNYTVENTRVGDATDYDKLTLEVWTNGTITARDAVPAGQGAGADHRGAGSVCPLLQLPQAGQHQHGGGSDLQDRGRDDEGAQPGPQEPGRGHQQAGHDGPALGRRGKLTARGAGSPGARNVPSRAPAACGVPPRRLRPPRTNLQLEFALAAPLGVCKLCLIIGNWASPPTSVWLCCAP